MSTQFKLDHFGFLKVSGVDAVTFMQGYTTCDLDALTDDTAQLGAICNIQGRMLANFLVTREDEDLVFRLHHSLVDKAITFLGKYIVFSKAELSDISDNLACFGSVIKDASGKPLPDPIPVVRNDMGIHLDLGNRQETWTTSDMQAESAASEWADAEIRSGTVWLDESTSEAFLPQMLNYHQLGGISFTKGCYLGQEIVARMQYRGELKKRLHRIASPAGDRKPESGDLVATGSAESLAVLSNPTGEPATVTWSDGTTETATPL